jgi:hypothetical protein
MREAFFIAGATRRPRAGVDRAGRDPPTVRRPDLQFTPTSSRIVASRWDAVYDKQIVHPSEHETRSGQINQTPRSPS